MSDDFDFDDDDDFDDDYAEDAGPRPRRRRRPSRRPRLLECPVCGEPARAQATMCGNCGERLQSRRQRQAEYSGAEKVFLPVGRPVTAIVAGYCGLISFVPILGIPFQITGVICGVMALRSIREDDSLIGAGRAWFGIIVGSLMLLLTLLLFAIAVARKAGV